MIKNIKDKGAEKEKVSEKKEVKSNEIKKERPEVPQKEISEIKKS